jgi:hypothetical protein
VNYTALELIFSANDQEQISKINSIFRDDGEVKCRGTLSSQSRHRRATVELAVVATNRWLVVGAAPHLGKLT